MAIYVMSDLHGMYDKFIKMLETIDFSDEDKLYIIGDVIDRGPNCVDILEYIITHKNITLLKGNHEQMYIDYIESDYRDNIYLYNGGNMTLDELAEKSTEHNLVDKYYKYFKTLKTYEVVNNYILVHAAFPYNDTFDKEFSIEHILCDDDINLWSRQYINNEKQYHSYIPICGHTPTPRIRQDKKPLITKLNSTIYIDCGCVFTDVLGCLRLDDLAQFYC